jgi:pimeloyl-ACP methyl ester carboxylesterase
MKYFSGFSLHGEKELFSQYIAEGDTTVAGFSYGAQQAFEYVYASKERIDRLILLSPAFFQTQKPSFIRTQLRYFEAGQEAYVKQFLSNVTYPSNFDLSSYLKVGTKEELEALLSYTWDKDKIQEILNRGTTIEVFLGSTDKIINSNDAFKFFKTSCTTYLLKQCGHALKD